MPKLAQMHAELEQAMLVKRRGGAAADMLDGGEALDGEIVGDQRGKPAVGDPAQQALVAAIENGATVVRKLVIDAAIVAQEQVGVAGMKTDQVGRLDLDAVALDDFHERVVADDHAALVAAGIEIDQDPPPLHAGRRHSFDAKSPGGRSGLGLEYAERLRPRPDRSDRRCPRRRESRCNNAPPARRPRPRQT